MKNLELERLRREVRASTTPEDRAKLVRRVEVLDAEAAELAGKFDSVASGVDLARLVKSDPQAFDLKLELESLLEPVIRQLKEASEGPRQIEQLRSRLAAAETRVQLASQAVANVTRNIAENSDPDLSDHLQRSLEGWKSRKVEFENQRQVAMYELEQRQKSRRSVLDSLRSFASDFFRTRGLNLAVAISSFFLAFVTLRFLHRRLVIPIQNRRSQSFYTRLINVLFQILVVVASVVAVLVVLFTANDWVLLVLVLIFLLGVGWASIRLVPGLFEQIRLLLDVGSVREGERLILDGLPWRVDALKVYSKLSNPELAGGVLRVPIRDLIGLRSRPMDDNEPWFPCRPGDWVLLADETRGRITVQTPEVVRLALPGGGFKTYPTEGFLGQSPRNLSAGFRVESTFGVDYGHQAVATTEIPTIMRRRLESELVRMVDGGELIGVDVEFSQAGPSSLDYRVLVDVRGSAAAKYEILRRAQARILVDACNEHGWTIPFTQLTVHQSIP